MQHIQELCELATIKDSPTTNFEDYVAWIAELKEVYIERDRTKHISTKFFYTRTSRER